MTRIEISPAPDLYAIEFKFRPPHLGVSIVLTATCALAAQLKAWSLFPEYERTASSTHVYRARYCEINWDNGRAIVVKQKKRPEILFPNPEEILK
jgi:hypothetical protein